MGIQICFSPRHSYLERGMDPNEENETSGIQDVCSVTLDKAPCGVRLCWFIYLYQNRFDFYNMQWCFICCLQLTDAVENVANVLHCAARTDLPMTEHTIMRLVHELTARLNSLVRELAKAVSSSFKKEKKKSSCVLVHLLGLTIKILCFPVEPQWGGFRISADLYRGGASNFASTTPKRPELYRTLV